MNRSRTSSNGEKTGRLIVVAGPSGAGKGTLIKELLKDPNTVLSVSCTTRAPRGTEVDGADYFFVTPEQFHRLEKDGEFLEHAQVFGNFYGTPRKAVEKQLDAGRDVILEIDVQGADQIRKSFPEAVRIFVMPPSEGVLHDRLAGRGTETTEQIEKRFSKARDEMDHAKEFDHIIVNDNLEKALKDMRHVLEIIHKGEGKC